MIKQKSYKLDNVLLNDNLLFNLRLDLIFKKVFLNIKSLPYLCLLISKYYKIPYKDLIKEAILVNGELPNKMMDKQSSRTDIVIRFRNYDFIIEMNHIGKDYTLEKNISYMLNLQSSKSSNENKYGKYIYTYLLNIDDYDILNKNDIIYESTLNYPKYNKQLYKNIKSSHINLDSLIKKYYNKDEKLNEFEKLLLIFIEQRKDKIREVVNLKDVEGVIEVMEKIKLDTKLPTYDGEELDRLERISFEEKKRKFNKEQAEFSKEQAEFSKEQAEFSKEQAKFSKEQAKFSKEQTKFNKEQKSIVKEFKKLGLSLNKISEITKLSIEQIKMLL